MKRTRNHSVNVGDTYGRLTIISEPFKKAKGKYKRVCVKVKCICGKENEVRVDLLERGKIKSCGCLANEIKKKLGVRYGRLTVISKPYRRTELIGRAMYVDVLCDCGVTKYIKAISLKSGITKSCGCIVPETTHKTHWVHGLTHHPLMSVWSGMIDRCHNVDNENYKNYGAIGVYVCDEWRNSFKKFYDWAIANGWKKGLEIDKDIKGGMIYSPENCLIVTKKENMRHRRNLKINIDDANNIRLLYATGCYTFQKLADAYNICNSGVSNIVHNKKWIN